MVKKQRRLDECASVLAHRALRKVLGGRAQWRHTRRAGAEACLRSRHGKERVLARGGGLGVKGPF